MFQNGKREMFYDVSRVWHLMFRSKR